MSAAKQVGPAATAIAPGLGSNISGEMEMNAHRNITTAPGDATASRADRSGALLDLEDPIIDLRHMTGIANAFALDLIGNNPPMKGENFRLEMSEDERDQLLFALADLLRRTVALHEQWRAAWAGKAVVS